MQKRYFMVTTLGVLLFIPAFTGTTKAAQERKTIEVSVTAEAMAAADLATLRFGYESTADTKDSAYDENVRVGNLILAALEKAGVPKTAIETEKIKLDAERVISASPGAVTKIQYSATQAWTVRLSASQAQNVLDLAVSTGANRVEGINWTTSDSDSLEAKAYGEALARAKKVADQIATQSNVKLGPIISVTNSANGRERFVEQFWVRRLENLSYIRTAPVLAPGTVRREVSVTVIFAIE